MKKAWGILGSIAPIFVAFMIQFIVSIVIMLGYGFVKGFQLAMEGVDDPDVITEVMEGLVTTDVLLFITAVAATICILVFAVWYKQASKNNQKVKFKEVMKPKHVGYIVLMGISLQLSLSVVIWLYDYLNPTMYEEYSEVIDTLGMGNSILSFLYIGLIAPISEEFIFRGVILENSKKVMPFAVANVLQAFLFGVYHMNMIQGTYAFIMGLCMGYVCYKLKSVYGAVLLHMVINISGMSLGLLPENSEVVNIVFMILTFVSYVSIFISCRYFYKLEESDKLLEEIVEV